MALPRSYHAPRTRHACRQFSFFNINRKWDPNLFYIQEAIFTDSSNPYLHEATTFDKGWQLKGKISGLSDGCMLSVPTVVMGGDFNVYSTGQERVEVTLAYDGKPVWLTLEISN